MRKMLLAALLVVLSCATMRGQGPVYYGLTGTMVGPDGKPFNGSIHIELARPTAVNLCSSPPGIVAGKEDIYAVVNGVIQNGTSAQLLTNSCMTPSVPYWVRMYDPKNALIYSDNWYLPRLYNTTNIDVGTLVDAVFSGPIVVAVPNAIVSTPAGEQVVTQQGSTFLTVNNLRVTGTFIASGALAGSITGNSATTTQFATTPTNCGSGSGQYSYGILSNGNALCGTLPTSPTLYYQVMATNGSTVPLRQVLNFGNEFVLNDSASPSETTVDLATVVAGASCTNCSLTYNSFGQITAASTGTGGGGGTTFFANYTASTPITAGGFATVIVPLGTTITGSYGASCQPMNVSSVSPGALKVTNEVLNSTSVSVTFATGSGSQAQSMTIGGVTCIISH